MCQYNKNEAVAGVLNYTNYAEVKKAISTGSPAFAQVGEKLPYYQHLARAILRTVWHTTQNGENVQKALESKELLWEAGWRADEHYSAAMMNDVLGAQATSDYLKREANGEYGVYRQAFGESRSEFERLMIEYVTGAIEVQCQVKLTKTGIPVDESCGFEYGRDYCPAS